jgi:very-short-patch-repair endonuclease
VKNLENVQGDERDVIFISIGYGRIEDGKVPMSFGPLNNEGGERRLNVLITRAKYRCEVFANITSDDIVTTTTTKFGIRALKSFLYFAQHGKFAVDQDVPILTERPFEQMVADRLTAAGYTVRNKVGSEGFYLDLAVVDPEHPGRYLLGIDCDGESYAQSKSARDRDRLRKQVLQGIGWKMYQVWSTEWYRNPEREFQRLLDFLEKVKVQTSLDDQEEEETRIEPATLLREEPEEIDLSIPVYEQAKLSLGKNTEELHLLPFDKIGNWIAKVVEKESPVHFEEMARRIAEAAGLSKIGSRARYTLEAATTYAVSSGLINKKDDFLWHPEMETAIIRNRSGLSSTSRKLVYIAPEEMSQAVQKVVQESVAIQPEVAAPLIARLFGFSRVTEEIKNELLLVLEHNVAMGKIKKDGELLKEI